MFKDKNFGLPQSLIDDVSKILEGTRSPSMGTPSKIGEKVAAGMPAKGKQSEEEMGKKVGRFAQPKLPNKLQDRLSKEKNPLAIGGVTESVKFAKFTKYLDENYHVEQLTEEEIQWIFENEFVRESEVFGTTFSANRPKDPFSSTRGLAGRVSNKGFSSLVAAQTPRAQTPLSGDKPKVPFGPDPQPLSGAKLGLVTPSSDPDEGMEDGRLKTSSPVAKAPVVKPKPRTPTGVSPAPAPVSSRSEPQDDWKSKVHAGGTGTVEGDTGSERPSPVSRRPSRPSRPSGGNGGDWKKSVFEPDGA